MKRWNDDCYTIKKENYINPTYISNVDLQTPPQKINEMRILYKLMKCIHNDIVSLNIAHIYHRIINEIKQAVIDGKDSVFISCSSWDSRTIKEIRSWLNRDGFFVTADFFNSEGLRISGWA